MSDALTLARPYARAAHAVARDAGQADAWSRMLATAAALAASPEIGMALNDPRLRRADAVQLLSNDTADAHWQAFVELLADNRRLALLPEIAALFEQLRADDEQVVRATVTSAGELSQDELASITSALQRRFGRQVRVQTAVDPALIGGAVIDAGDLVIDGSLKGKLARLQDALIH